MTLKRATAEGVAVAWAKTLGLSGVATSLPGKLDSWPVVAGSVRGFVTVDSVVGGRVRDTALRQPIVSFSAWAALPDSDKPQWYAANDLAEILWAPTYAHPFPAVTVQQDQYHRSAVVTNVHGISEPRRLPDLDESRAHFSLEMEIFWIEVPG